MCRGVDHGGRRCPYQGTTGYKKKAAANRKNNRTAKKNAKKFFAERGMTKTAEAVSNLPPSQIAGVINELGLVDDVVGDDIRMPAEKGAPVGDEVLDIAREEAAEADLDDYIKKDDRALAIDQFMDFYNTVDQKRERSVLAEVTEDNYEQVNDLYRSFDALDLPEDPEDRDEMIREITREINSKINTQYFPDYDNTHSAVKTNMQESPVTKTHSPELLEDYIKDRDVTNTFAEALKDSSDVDLVSRGILPEERADDLNDLTNGDSRVVSHGAGMYSMYFDYDMDEENVPSMYFYAPNGLEDISDISFSRYQERQYPKNNSFMDGLGFSGVSEDSMRKLVETGDFNSNVASVNNSAAFLQSSAGEVESYGEKEKQDHQKSVDRIVDQEMERLSRLVRRLLEGSEINELFASNAMENNGTYLQEGLGRVIDIDPDRKVTATKMMLFGKYRTGSVEPYKAYYAFDEDRSTWDVSYADQQKIAAGLATEIQAADTFFTRHEQERGGRARKNIKDYSSDYYEQFAESATGIDRENGFYEKVDSVNRAIRDYQDSGINTSSRVLYRNASVPRGMTTKKYFESVEIGDVYTTTKLTSTSHNSDAADNFFEPGVTVKNIYTTSKGAPVEMLSTLPEEMEYLLPAGEDFVLVHKEKSSSGEYTFHYADKASVDVDYDV